MSKQKAPRKSRGVIARSAATKQSRIRHLRLDCFASLAMTNEQTKSPAEIPRGFCCVDYRERGFFRMILSENRKTTFRDHALSVLGRSGSVLLFQALRLSTIGAEDFDGRV